MWHWDKEGDEAAGKDEQEVNYLKRPVKADFHRRPASIPDFQCLKFKREQKEALNKAAKVASQIGTCRDARVPLLCAAIKLKRVYDTRPQQSAPPLTSHQLHKRRR